MIFLKIFYQKFVYMKILLLTLFMFFNILFHVKHSPPYHPYLHKPYHHPHPIWGVKYGEQFCIKNFPGVKKQKKIKVFILLKKNIKTNFLLFFYKMYYIKNFPEKNYIKKIVIQKKVDVYIFFFLY